MTTKTLNILMPVALVVLGFILLKVLIRHHWFLLFLWLSLPFFRLWLSGDVMRVKLSLELHRFAKKLLIGIALVLSVINLINSSSMRVELGKEFIDGYRIVKNYDCEPPQADYGPTGPAPDECWVEDLSRVRWYSKVALYLIEWLSIGLVIAVPLFTLFAGEEGLNKLEIERAQRSSPS